jgi:hypothetical protein
MLVEPIENGIEADQPKQQEFFELAKRFRHATGPDGAKRLGDKPRPNGLWRPTPKIEHWDNIPEAFGKLFYGKRESAKPTR